jgi:acyl-CoA thioesterase-1
MSQKLISLSILVVVVFLGLGYLLHQASKQKVSVRSTSPTAASSASISYLPLGDSYTIGQSVAESDRWPNQLVALYKPGGKTLHIVANPAVTGYTTQNLIDTELPLVTELHPQFVTLQIGVNDYVQGITAQVFTSHLQYIVSFLQQHMAEPKNILLVTIPDYPKTPTGAQFGDPTTSTAGVEAFNQIITSVGAKAGIVVADIFPTSQAVATDPSLIASDGLHPSAKEYAAWTSVILQTLNSAGIPHS